MKTGYRFFIAVSSGQNPISYHFHVLARSLCERGHHVLLLTNGPQSGLFNAEENPQTAVWPSPRPTKLADALFLHRLIGQYQPDCLIAHFGSVNLMTVVGWLRRVPVRLAWYHTLSVQIDTDTQLSPAKIYWLRQRKRLIYGLCTHLVANSAAAKQDLCTVFSVPAEKVTVWQNSVVDVDLPHECKSEESVFTCVGRLDLSKGQDTVIQALPYITADFPQVKVAFIGAGAQLGFYRELARKLGVEDHCEFVGSVDNREVRKRMRGAVATLVPSRAEAFGLVNVESFAAGTPVIGSAVDGIVEIVTNGENGLLAPPDRPDAWAAAMCRLLADPQLRQQLGAAARQTFLDKFEQSFVVRQQADWLERVVHETAKR